MQDFLRGQIKGEIQEVPGIGPAAAKRLAAGDEESERITNTFQLIGKFLMLKGAEDEESDDKAPIAAGEHVNRFWHWLAEKDVKSHRSAIVQAIAEKMNQSLPGIYDAGAYDEDSDDDDDSDNK